MQAPAEAVFDPRPIFEEFGLTQPEDIKPEKLEEMSRLAHQLFDLFMSATSGWSEDDRRYLGRLCQPFLKGRKSWKEAEIRIAHFWTVIQHHFREELNWNIWTLVAPASVRHYCLNMALWFESGFQKVIIDNKLASSLCATTLSADVTGMVVPPWPAFMVEIEKSTLPLVKKDNRPAPVTHIFVRVDDNGSLVAEAMAGRWDLMSLGSFTPADLVSRDTEEQVDAFRTSSSFYLERMRANFTDAELKQSGFTIEEAELFFSRNARLSVMSQRLIAGLCLLMSDPRNLTPFRPKLKPSIVAKERKGTPIVRAFKITKPVVIDVSASVRDYVLGTRSSAVTVQTLVRGHWKQQPHGSGLTLRKIIHVEPYWRGPEEAPVVLRPHVVSDAG